MRTSPFAWLDARLLFLTKSFACRLSKPDIRIFLTLEPQHVRKATTFQGWAIYKDGGARVSEGETSAGGALSAALLDGRLFIMFDPVVTTDSHLAYAGARLHSNNTSALSNSDVILVERQR